ncbi:MAG: nitroreductase family protein [Candidatus Binataceae bacterium]
MDVLKAIMGRRVQRAFADKPVEPGKLKQIVEAGRHAMSASNRQPWQFIVIRKRETLDKLAAHASTGKFLAQAPAAIAILKDKANERWADIDCAQAVQNMATAAWSLGLGTCWVGNFEADKISELLNVPSGWAVFTVLPFGYSDPANPPQDKPLKPRTENTHFERFGDHQE